MQCAACRAENRNAARFCFKCGEQLVTTCVQCGAELPPGASFCDGCGAPADTAPAEKGLDSVTSQVLQRLVPKEYAERLLATHGRMPAERRTVTLLFCDIRGSTALAETLDPEEVLDIINGAFEVLIEPVTRYGGTLARLMGDAILAFFGAPTAHDDDPERACRAALDIVRGVQQYARTLEEVRGIPGFAVRLGIHTGLVVVGEVGSSRRVEYTAMGDAVNLAARLEQAARPGTVLISADTQRLVAPLFDTKPQGHIKVKGHAERVAVYRLLAARPDAGKPRGIPGLDSPLVGREPELEALRTAVQRLQDGQGGIVTLVGEAGIGKSRLVTEVRKEFSAAEGHTSLQWLEGRCLSYGASLPYLLWLDVLRHWLGVTLDDAPAAVEAGLRQRLLNLCPGHFENVYPFLARLMSLPLAQEAYRELEELDSGELRDRTFKAMATLLDCLAQQPPLVLVCEDLHWADSISVQLLEHLLAHTPTQPLLLVCVFRPLRAHPSWQLRETIRRVSGLHHTGLDLEPLSAGQSQALVTNLLSAEGLPTGLQQRILDRAEGNPFFLEEVLRSLIDVGALAQDEQSGRWRVGQAVASIDIPDTVQGVLLARIDRLSEDTKRVLQMAAVIGRIFRHRLLSELAREERNLDGQLRALQREEMIRLRARLPELEYIFKHDLTREAAYNGLLKRDRRMYHCQVGEALERLFPERLEEQLGLLADHWERAGVAGKAVDYLQRAGDQARLAYAHNEAVDYYERALKILKQTKQYERAARTLMKLGLTYYTAFNYEAARQTYEEAFALSQQTMLKYPVMSSLHTPPPLRIVVDASRTTNAIHDPAMGRSQVIDHVFSGLVELTPGMNIVPDMACNWEVLDGGRTYIFYLRKDARWSDGVRVTAGDFEYAWKRVLQPTTRAELAMQLYDVKNGAAYHTGQVSDPERLGVRAIDRHTLRVELEEPTAYFLYLLAYRAAFPVPRHRIEALSQDWAEAGNLVCNGPFVIETSQPGESLVLARRSGYHGRFGGNLQRVEMIPRRDPPDDLAQYEANALDVLDLWQVPLSIRDRVREQHADEYRSGPQPLTCYFGFNTARPPFDDVRARLALALAIDRPALTELSLKTYSFPGTGGFVAPGIPGHSPDIALPYDPIRARQLLAEAGYPSGRSFPEVEALRWTQNPYVQIVQDHWRQNLGIDVVFHRIRLEQFYHRLENDPPHLFESCWWADYPDPASFLQGALVWTALGCRNKTFDTLVNSARHTTNPKERIKLYQEADRLLINQARIVPRDYGRYHRLLKPWVKQHPVSAMGWLWTRFKDIAIDPH